MSRTEAASWGRLFFIWFLFAFSSCKGQLVLGEFSSCGVQPAAGGLLSSRGIIDASGRCFLPEETAWRHAQVFIPSRDDEVLSASGAGILRVSANGLTGADQGYVLLLYVPPGTERITVTLARDGRPWQRRRFQFLVGTWDGTENLRGGSDAHMNGDLNAAETLLKSALHDAAPANQAFAWLRLADIAGERQLHAQMLDLLQVVEGMAAKRGYRSLELSSQLFASELLARRHEFAPAAAKLSAIKPPVLGLPAMEAWHGLYRGRLHNESGDYVLALHAVETGLHAAQKHLLQDAGVQLCRLKTELLQSLGRSSEAAQACNGTESWLRLSALEPCLQAHSRLFLAHGQLSRYEATWPRSLALDDSVAKNLEEAERLLKELCLNQDALLSYALRYEAKAKLLTGELANASRILKELEKKKNEESPATQRSVNLLRGQLALAEKNWPLALDIFAAHLKGEPSSQSVDTKKATASRETRWNGYLGLAQTHEGIAEGRGRNSPEQEAETRLAVDYYKKAEDVLDEWSRDYKRLPLVEGRQTFLERYKRGTSLYIALLARRQRNREALDVILHAHHRMLGALPAEQLAAESAAALHERYWTERLKLQKSLASDPPASVEAREEQQRAMTKKMFELIEDWLPKDGSQSSQDPAIKLAEDELLLACHPGSVGEICLAATLREDETLEVQATSILRPLSPEGHRADLGQDLLVPFRRQLEKPKIKTIRALANDMLLRVPLHLLTISGELVGAKWRVVYTLALAPLEGQATAKQTAPDRRTFVMVPDPASYPLDAEAVRKSVQPQLKKLGWPIPTDWLMLGNPVLVGNGAVAPNALEALRGRLQDAWLFHFAGHVEDGAEQGRIPSIPTGLLSPSIMLPDILMLSRVVPHVLLIGCSTGAGPGANIRLGQILLVRGSQEAVVSTERIESGAFFVERLYPHLNNDDDSLPLASAFQRALASNQQHAEDFKSFFVLTR